MPPRPTQPPTPAADSELTPVPYRIDTSLRRTQSTGSSNKHNADFHELFLDIPEGDWAQIPD